jgi:ribonuclease Z
VSGRTAVWLISDSEATAGPGTVAAMSSARELVVLGTASQVPTRHRNHNGYLLRWDDEAVLFDPGEGTQRQMVHAGVAASVITRICITHLHGDHCLGLPGILQRLSLDKVDHPIHLYYPASGQPYIDRLRHASIFHDHTDVRCHPVFTDGPVAGTEGFTLVARRLDHGVDSVGYQLIEPDGQRMLPERLTALGVEGPMIGELQRSGQVPVCDRTVSLDEVSEPRVGQRFAFVMDSRICAAAVELAERADLLVCEATFLDGEVALATAYGHMTARQAAEVASAAGARCLVLAHFSQRYDDTDGHIAEASEVFATVVAAEDLMRIDVPKRQ